MGGLWEDGFEWNSMGYYSVLEYVRGKGKSWLAMNFVETLNVSMFSIFICNNQPRNLALCVVMPSCLFLAKHCMNTPNEIIRQPSYLLSLRFENSIRSRNDSPDNRDNMLQSTLLQLFGPFHLVNMFVVVLRKSPLLSRI
jgi:hypothetical protein